MWVVKSPIGFCFSNSLIEFYFKPGKCNTNADTMSQIPADTQHTVFSIVDLCPLGLEEVRSSQANDAFLSKVIQAMEQGKPPPGLTCQAHKLFFKEEVLCRVYHSPSSSDVTQIVVPFDLRDTILQQLHNNGVYRKPWPRLKKGFIGLANEVDIEKWVRECQACQRRNPPHTQPLKHLWVPL